MVFFLQGFEPYFLEFVAHALANNTDKNIKFWSPSCSSEAVSAQAVGSGQRQLKPECTERSWTETFSGFWYTVVHAALEKRKYL